MNRHGWYAYFKDVLAPYLNMDIYQLWSENMSFIFNEMQRMQEDDEVRYQEHEREKRKAEIESRR